MKKISLFSVGLFLFGALFVFNAKAESIVPDGVEHVEAFNVEMNVNSDSTISVSENINYAYGDQAKQGFIRYIPLNYQDLSGTLFSVEITDVSVINENGNPYAFTQAQTQNRDGKKRYLAISIDTESQQISGAKTYIIHYSVAGAIKFLADHDEIFWNITGDKWPVYVKYPEVMINLPKKVDKESVTSECFIGFHAATMECIDRLGIKMDRVDYSYKGVVSGEGMTTIMRFPKGVVQKKVIAIQNLPDKLSTGYRSLMMFLAAAMVIIIIVFIVKKYFKLFSWKKCRKFLLFVGKKFKLHHAAAHAKRHANNLKNKSRKWWITFGVVLAVLVLAGGVLFWKIDMILNKISTKGESVGSIVQATLPNQGELKGETDDRINVLLLGVLGANHPGGGLNTDTIMVASLKPKANAISLVSIPRDLWVVDPGKDTKSKINSVYVYGEEKGPGQGIADIESLVGEISGLKIDYTVMVSTQGFVQLVDTMGGVEVDLSKPFDESAQFSDVSVCDSDTYTIPTGEIQTKKNKKGRVTAQYPLCSNKSPECGGDFHLPAGKNILSGQQSLCFVRSRYLTSDFERAKRQQLVLQQFKKRMTEIGLPDFMKINSILDNLGANVQTDMQLWEMRRMFDLYRGMDNPKVYQKVLEDSKEGLLYSPKAVPETGYILLPQDDNYDKISDLFQNIFENKGQSDIKPKI